MPSDVDRAKIDRWVAEAADHRVVFTTRRGDQWDTQALEDGDVVYEETEFGDDEPVLERLAAWCERHNKKAELRPPVKANGGLAIALGAKQKR